MRRVALLLLLLAGCAESGRDHPVGPDDEAVVVAPRLDPPPSDAEPLSEEEVVQISEGAAPQVAIDRLDQHPFAFPLDSAALARMRAAGLDPAILDYLDKRSRVDWEALRGDVDPAGPK